MQVQTKPNPLIIINNSFWQNAKNSLNEKRQQLLKLASALVTKSPPDNAKELVKRYKMGERNFENASLGSEHLNCEDLNNINLRGADLSSALFLGVDFTNTDLSNADLSGGHFCDCNFTGANLSGTNFQHSNLDGCKY
ncbi:MAG TPA: pentapeptide repeat-containing protein [Candidatus Obscuribacterales bacterium]